MKSQILFSLPRSIFFNFRFLPIKQALKLPILLGAKVKVEIKNKNGIIIEGQIKTGMIQLGTGFGSFSQASYAPSFLQIDKDSKIIFSGSCYINRGFSIASNRGGIIYFGNKMHLNSYSLVSSNSVIRICDGVRCGWNCTIIDWDGHQIVDKNSGEIINNPKPITIGEHTWLGAKCSILKGVELAHHSIIPYGSIITKSNEEPFTVFGGRPNRVIKKDVIRIDKYKLINETDFCNNSNI